MGVGACRLSACSIAAYTGGSLDLWIRPNLFVHRPIVMIQSRVTSVAYDGSRASVSYSFTHGGDRFGGTAWVKRRASAADWAPGQPIDVIFDPLNPNKSKASIL